MYWQWKCIHHVFVLQEKDPFDEDLNAEFHIGSVKVWLQSLAFNVSPVFLLYDVDQNAYSETGGKGIFLFVRS